MRRTQNVMRVFAHGNRCEFELGRNFGWQVFQAVHCEIDTALDQCLFDLLGEHSFCADFGQGNIGNFVAGGLDDFDGDRVAASFKKALDVMCLRQG